MRGDETGVEPCNQSDWWAGATEEDALAPAAADDADVGLWPGAFVPPPPRPHFLDDSAAPDGLTTCDLCAWAWRDRPAADAPPDNETRLGWLLTLAIVSIVSAAVGAVVMVTVLHCRNRLKNLRFGGVCSSRSTQETGVNSRTGNSELVSRPAPGKTPTVPSGDGDNERASRENHYTLQEDAVYAELDRDSARAAFHNSAYNGSDTEPSSAYYSDLSAADRERPYEAVTWEAPPSRPPLSAITETVTVPSDYV